MAAVLVTGGAGFIGSHLVDALLDRGDRVTVIDDLSTGRWTNLAHRDGSPELRMIVASAAERALVQAEVARHDLVYHLASAVGVRLVVERPVYTIEDIVEPTRVVLAACARFRRPVVLTSSSEVYGKSTALPFREDADVVMGPTEKPRWAYACAKALDEFMALAHHHASGLPVFCARLFNTVGPRQRGTYGMVLPTFVAQALAGRPITVYGDGEQRRCFCAVSDVVRGLIALPAAPAASGRVVNLGSQEEVTIFELAERVKAACGSSSEIRLVPYSEAFGPGFDDMRRRVPDLGRAQDWVGWRPSQTLESVIESVREALIAETSPR